MAIPATYVTSNTFNIGSAFGPEFAVGVRVRADCGADGLVYGVVQRNITGTNYATITMILDDNGVPLTSNLAYVLHGNDIPLSLCDHASHHAPGGRDPLPLTTGKIWHGDGGYAKETTLAELGRPLILYGIFDPPAGTYAQGTIYIKHPED